MKKFSTDGNCRLNKGILLLYQHRNSPNATKSSKYNTSDQVTHDL